MGAGWRGEEEGVSMIVLCEIQVSVGESGWRSTLAN